MKKEILDAFATHLSDKSVTEKTIYKSHSEWSSLRALLIVSEIELRTSVLISSDVLRSCSTISSLYKEIRKSQSVQR